MVLCARRHPEHPTVRLERGDEIHDLPIPIISEPSAAREVDWALLATKAHQTAGAAVWFRALMGWGTTLTVVQNGLNHLDRVAPYVLESAGVLPALAYVAAETVSPGRVRQTFDEGLVVPAGPLGEGLADLLDGSFLPVRRTADFVTESWRKLLLNLALNPVTAMTGRPVGMLRGAGVRPLIEALINEAANVGRAAGANLSPADVDGCLALIDSLPADYGTSMLSDRRAGREMETEAIVGEVVRAADKVGMPAPRSHTLLVLLRALERPAPVLAPAA
ncbi:oxidoreductase [Rugosimonospora acidiphila]|uniref:2-dehydropantoate 2-reductase n=1 Tax=Rugosimonospora acidiphila TaxID=556531 RepID=A0ABP9S221_9ACTN